MFTPAGAGLVVRIRDRLVKLQAHEYIKSALKSADLLKMEAARTVTDEFVDFDNSKYANSDCTALVKMALGTLNKKLPDALWAAVKVVLESPNAGLDGSNRSRLFMDELKSLGLTFTSDCRLLEERDFPKELGKVHVRRVLPLLSKLASDASKKTEELRAYLLSQLGGDYEGRRSKALNMWDDHVNPPPQTVTKRNWVRVRDRLFDAGGDYSKVARALNEIQDHYSSAFYVACQGKLLASRALAILKSDEQTPSLEILGHLKTLAAFAQRATRDSLPDLDDAEKPKALRVALTVAEAVLAAARVAPSPPPPVQAEAVSASWLSSAAEEEEEEEKEEKGNAGGGVPTYYYKPGQVWETFFDEEGVTYYYNSVTGDSTYDRPGGEGLRVGEGNEMYDEDEYVYSSEEEEEDERREDADYSFLDSSESEDYGSD